MRNKLKSASGGRKQGFTLIELVVVMAIIAVLAALMVAALSAARRQARNTMRLSDAKTFQIALEMYHSKYGKFPINCTTYYGGGMESIYKTTDCTWGNAPGKETARTLLDPYLQNFSAHDPAGDDTRVRYCPHNSDSYSLYVINEPKPSFSGEDSVPWMTSCDYRSLSDDVKSGTTDFSMR